MLNTTFHEFTYTPPPGTRTDESQPPRIAIVRASAPYSVPRDIASRVMLVGNVAQLPHVHSVKVVDDDTDTDTDKVNGWSDACGGKCTGKVTPAVLKARYKITDSASKNRNMNR